MFIESFQAVMLVVIYLAVRDLIDVGLDVLCLRASRKSYH